jgi:hypothetical protein
MANKTFLQIQDSLANMWGGFAASELVAQDLVDIKDWINAAYFDIYAPADGKRAWWSTQQHSDMVKAQVSATLGLTHGSKVVTGYVFEDKFAGSFVRIGDRYFRYSGSTTVGMTTTYYLVQPWPGETGSYGATIFHNAVSLPWNVVEVSGLPTLLGVGLLAPLPDPDSELTLRTEPAFDFTPKFNRSPFAQHRKQFSQQTYFDTGDPRFYHIDQASVGPSYAVGNRFHLYPIPEIAYTFDLVANVVPNALTADADVPILPARVDSNILMALCREKLVKNSNGRMFTGDPRLIIDEAERARSQINSFRRAQVNVAGAFRVRAGW